MSPRSKNNNNWSPVKFLTDAITWHLQKTNAAHELAATTVVPSSTVSKFYLWGNRARFAYDSGARNAMLYFKILEHKDSL